MITAPIRPGRTIEDWVRAGRRIAIAADPVKKLRMAKARARARRL